MLAAFFLISKDLGIIVGGMLTLVVLGGAMLVAYDDEIVAAFKKILK